MAVFLKQFGTKKENRAPWLMFRQCSGDVQLQGLSRPHTDVNF
jgi:hypothetical protein